MNADEIKKYWEGKQEISDYKNCKNGIHLSLSILNKDGVVIGELSCLDRNTYMIPGIIESMAKWRQDNMQWFWTQFESTPERTKEWIENIILPDPTRIMFLIYTFPEHNLIGHIGSKDITESTAEVDNVMRGNPGAKGMMHYAEITLLSWLFIKMGMKMANLWVFYNNERAIKLHSSAGFSLRAMKPYREMVISKETLLAKHPWIRETL